MKIVLFTYKTNLGVTGHDFLYIKASDITDDNRDDVIQKIEAFKPDLFLEQEYNDGVDPFTKIYRAFPNTPKAFWMIDAHTDLVSHIAYAKQFDYVFCAQSWFVDLMKNQLRARLFYLPLCHSQTLEEYDKLLATPEPERTIELSFVGNIRSIHVDRKYYVEQFIEQLGSKFVAKNQDYDSTLHTLRESQMTFNCSLNDDLNFRVWEALAMNTPLVTDFVPDILSIRNLPRHIKEIYPRITDQRLKEKISNPVVSTVDFIRGEHTITHRYKQALWMIETGTQYEF